LILVVAAWRPELRGLGRGPTERAVVGVGPVEAALGTTRLLAELQPDAVILVGTAGAYPSAGQPAGIGQVIVARAITFVCSGTARGLSYLPGPMPQKARGDARLRKDLAAAAGISPVDLACPPAITRSRAAAAALARLSGASAENLEAFAVARAAAAAGVRFAAVLGIANEVGPRAHLQWKTHGDAAARAACAAVRLFLDGPARREARAPTR
jgi:nucleoside phosphorylase